MGIRAPLVLGIEGRKFVPEVKVCGVSEVSRGRSGVEAGLKRQSALRDLLAEIVSRLQEKKLDRSAGAEGWSVEGRDPKETLRAEDAGAGSEKRRLRGDPNRFEIRAKLEGMAGTDVSEVFGGLEVLFAVVMNAAREAARVEKVSDDDGGLKASPDGIEVEIPDAKVERGLRCPVATENVNQVGVDGLVEDGIVAEGGRQSLAWGGARNELFAIIVEEVADV